MTDITAKEAGRLESEGTNHHTKGQALSMVKHRCARASRGPPNVPCGDIHWTTPTEHSCRNNSVGDGTVDGTTWCFPPSAPARWRIRIPGLRYEENPRPQPQGAPRVHHLPGPLGSWWWPVGEPDHPSSSSFFFSSFFFLALLSSFLMKTHEHFGPGDPGRERKTSTAMGFFFAAKTAVYRFSSQAASRIPAAANRKPTWPLKGPRKEGRGRGEVWIEKQVEQCWKI